MVARRVCRTLPIQYADYAVWQRERLQGELLEELRSYWARSLEGAPELLRLPTDRPRLPVQRHDGEHHRIALDRRLADDLVALGQEEGATFFIMMLAAFTTLLYRLTGEEDIVIGSPIANRNNIELQGLIGFFTQHDRAANAAGWQPLLPGGCRTCAGHRLGRLCPPGPAVRAGGRDRGAEAGSGLQPAVSGQLPRSGDRAAGAGLTGIEVEPIAVDIGFSRFDLALELELESEALGGYFEYDRDLFDSASIVSFEENLRELLAEVVEDPDIPILALAHGSRKAAAGREIRRRPTR